MFNKMAVILIFFLVFSLAFFNTIVIVFAENVFTDGFEDQTFNKWDGNGATSWQIGTFGSGTGGSADPHGGSYDSWSDETHSGLLTSDDIDLSGASGAGFSCWIHKDDIEPTDFQLNFYDGTTYDLIVELDTIGADDTWLYYSINLDSQYFISNFRIQFNSIIAKSENVWLDDIILNKTVSENNPPTNDLCDSDTYFDVDVDGEVAVTISDLDGVADFLYSEIQVTTAGSEVFTLRWTQETNVFSEESDASGVCTLNTGASSRINIDSDTDKISFIFQVNVLAMNGYVAVEVTTYDDQSASDIDNYPNEFTINFYSSITVTDSTHAWSELSPGDSQILVGGDGDIDFTITSNADFDIQAKSDGNLISGSNTIPIANIKIHASDLGSAVSLTTSYADVLGLTSQSRGEDLAKSLKLWLTVPLPQEDGDYSYTLYVQVVKA